MKKIFFGMMALVAMVATSCQQDVDLGINGEATTTVSFNLATPQIANRADFSDGTTATHLQYAVYDVNGNILTDLAVTNDEIHTSKVVKFQLTTGNTYTVLFWAAAPNAPYTVDLAAKTMEVDYTGAVSSDENRDAFYFYSEPFTVSNGMAPIAAELRRPFAQLNIGTNDYDESTSAGYTVTKAKVTTYAYKTLHFDTGVVEGKDMVHFDYAAIPTAQAFPVSGYDYMAMNYLLMANTKETVDVVFTYSDGAVEKQRTVGSVPVQRNYRTNLYGQLLTSDLAANVEIKPEYAGTHKVSSVSNTAELHAVLTSLGEGDIISLQNNITLTEGANGSTNGISVTGAENFTLDLNGYTLSSNLGNNALRFKIGDNNNVTNTTVNITIKNGKVVSGENNFCAISAATAGNGNKLVLNLEDIEVENNNAKDYAVKAWNGAVINAKNVAVTSNAGGAFYAVGGEIVLDNSTATTTNGSANYLSAAIGVSNNGKATINSGTYTTIPSNAANGQWVAYLMNSGGELVINGGTFEGTVASNNASYACGLISADTGTKVTINGGTFNSNGAILDMRNNLGDASKQPSAILVGGNYSSNPTISGLYGNNLITLAENHTVVEKDGRWIVEEKGYSVDAQGNYHIQSANGWAWMAAQADNFFGSKTIYLDNDIDFADAEVAVTRIWTIETKATFDGQGHTIKNFNITANPNANNQALFEGLMNIKNLTIDNAYVQGSGYVGVLAGTLYGSIDNCHIISSLVVGTFWQVGGFVGQHCGGNITNCTIKHTGIYGPAAVGTLVGLCTDETGAAVSKFENCTIENSRIIQYYYSHGAEYDTLFGVAVGGFWASATYHLNNITLLPAAEFVLLTGVTSSALHGEIKTGTVFVDGVQQ